MRVRTESGTVYVFSPDGSKLVSRDRPGSTLPQYRDEPINHWRTAWPPEVGRRMVFRPTSERHHIYTTDVAEVVPSDEELLAELRRAGRAMEDEEATNPGIHRVDGPAPLTPTPGAAAFDEALEKIAATRKRRQGV